MSTNNHNKRPRRTKSGNDGDSNRGPPSTIDVPVQSWLLQLSDSCRVHHKQCHARDDNGDKDTTETCQLALESVRKILPKVEAACRYVYQHPLLLQQQQQQPLTRSNAHSGRSKSALSAKQTNGPEVSEVINLGLFYREALCAGYCPLAPGLFLTPDGNPSVHEVLLRIHYLYQQFTSPNWIADTIQKSISPPDDLLSDQQQQYHPRQYHKACQKPSFSTWVVEKTISHFLSFLITSNGSWSPQTRAHFMNTIERDLIQTLMDLAILSDYLLHENTTTQKKDKNGNNAASTTKDQDDASLYPPIQIVLFAQTSKLDYNLRKNRLSTTGTAAKQQDETTTTMPSEPYEYILDIPPTKYAIWSLQSATLNAMTRLLDLMDGIVAVKLPSEVEDESVEQLLPPRPLRPTSELPNEALQDLLASLRPILLSTCVSVLAERARSAALECLLGRGSLLFLDKQQQQPEGMPAMDLGLVIELALLGVHAIGRVFVRQEQWRQYASTTTTTMASRNGTSISGKPLLHVPTQSEDVLYSLMMLLRRTVLFPPRVRGYTPTETIAIVRRQVLMPLLEECLPWMQQKQQQVEALSTPSETASTPSVAATMVALEEMVLRAIHVCLFATPQGESTTTIVNSKDVVATAGPLLDMIMKTNNAHTSCACMAILTALLKPQHIPVTDLCATAWAQRNDRDSSERRYWVPQKPSPPLAYPQEIVDMVQQFKGEEDERSRRSPKKDPEVAKSPTTTSPTPPISSSGKTRGKRRASLLGSNPLVIQSPMATKRQRVQEENAEKDVTATRTKVSADSCFIEDVLLQFLSEGLHAAQSITGYLETGDTKTNPPADFWNSARVFVGSFKLLHCLMALGGAASSPDWFAVERSDSRLFANSMVECWGSLSNCILERAKTRWGRDWEDLAAMMIDCGWNYLQTCAGQVLLPPALDSRFYKGGEKCCSALTVVAGQTKPRRPFLRDEQVCQGTCREMLGALAVHEPCCGALFGSAACLCSLSDTVEEREDSAVFQRDCDVLALASLPLSSRCFILASVLIQKQRRHEDGVTSIASSWGSLQSGLSAFRVLITSQGFEWNELTCSSLVTAPLQMVVSLLSPDQLEPSGTHDPRLGIVLLDFMRSVMLPAIESIPKLKDNHLLVCASNALFATIKQLQWLHLMLDGKGGVDDGYMQAVTVGWDVSNMMGVLRRSYSIVPSGETTNDCESTCSGANDALRRELTVRLSHYVVADAENNTTEMGRILEGLGSSLRLIRWKCVAWECLRLRSTVELQQFKWLMHVPFSDSEESVREYTSRELGKVLLTNNGYAMFALFANEDFEWKAPADGMTLENSSPEVSGDGSAPPDDDLIEITGGRTESLDRVVKALFVEIDELIQFYCDPTCVHVPQQQLSVQASPTKTVAGEELQDCRVRRLSAIRVLLSLCCFADTDTYIGMKVLEEAVIRLTRLASAFNESETFRHSLGSFLNNYATSASTIGAMIHLCRHCYRCPDVLTGSLVRDVLVPYAGLKQERASRDNELQDISPACRERRYFRLLTFLRALLAASTKGIITGLQAVDDFLRDAVPHVLTHLTERQDYDSLRLFAAFYPYFVRSVKKVVSRRRAGNTSLREQEVTLGDSKFKAKTLAGPDMKTTMLERKTHEICLDPHNVGRLLTAVLMKVDKEALTFFRCTVLHGKEEWTLRRIVVAAEQEIVKALAANLGRDPQLIGQAILAVQTAAIAMLRDSNGAEDDRNELSTRWITKNFMSIIVMVIQHRWKSKTDQEKLCSMRSLRILLRFLSPSEAPKYLSQVIAIVSAAIEDGSDSVSDDEDEPKLVICMRLRVLAVEVLEKFCLLLDAAAWPLIGQNLMTISVSLIPALSDLHTTTMCCEVQRLSRQAVETAVRLLEWLTDGDRGNCLANYFLDIPFLPTTSQLDGVRANLKTRGVVFDNLVLTNESADSHPALSSRDSYSFGGSTGSSEGMIVDSEKGRALQAALSKRLNTVCELLGNENVSIRKAILEHLLGLLRANRSLFHGLVANEGSSSNAQFLTVQFPEEDNIAVVGNFSITKMMGILMNMCVNEEDSNARSLLGACLGEIGAISEHRLGGTSMSTVLRSADSLDDRDGAFRLPRPPWKSKKEHYELQLVKRNLVVAYKATTNTEDQNKMAFAFQQLLKQLDSPAASRGDAANPERGEESHQVTEPRTMSDWLKEELHKAGVFEIVDPFWNTNFAESEKSQRQLLAAVEPPFFQSCKTYYLWLSQWCRFMLLRCHSAGSPWDEVFYSCRTAVKAQAGLTVAEFILPLLVLNRLCFGGVQESNIILREIQDVLGNRDNGMSQTEHRKAVNTIFVVIDTWQHWMETEKERRHRADPKQSQHTSQSACSEEMWDADDCLFRIDEILSKVPLVLRAEAAASVSMHARALRLVEMAERERMIEIFNEPSDSSRKSDGQSCPPKVKPIQSRALGTRERNAIELNLMKEALANLNNYETMSALEEGSRNTEPRQRTMDSIRLNEAAGNWELALRDYERLQQLRGDLERTDSSLQWGALQCLLKLGQFESVLNQVRGIVRTNEHDSAASQSSLAKPFAVEAAWRLGRWKTLAELTNESNQPEASAPILGPDAKYQVAKGKAMLALHDKNPSLVVLALNSARQAVMESLSSAARESYARAYPYLVRLQSLREIEDARFVLCTDDDLCRVSFAELTKSESHDGWGWQKRLEMVSSSNSAAIIDTRLALARLAKDRTGLEGSLFLTVGKKARKSGLLGIAADSLAQAETTLQCVNNAVSSRDVDGLLHDTKMQLAKLKYASGHLGAALRLLGENEVDLLHIVNAKDYRSAIISQERESTATLGPQVDDEVLVQRFSRRILLSTQWIVEGGLKNGAETMKRWELITSVAPRLEKGHFEFAKFIDSGLIQSRVSSLMKLPQAQAQSRVDEDAARAEAIYWDATTQMYMKQAMDSYATCLRQSLKHVYHALPRLLSLWFDLCGVSAPATERNENSTPPNDKRQSSSFGSSRRRSSSGSKSTANNAASVLKSNQNGANQLMADMQRKVPAQAYYTALPQLLAQIMHKHNETPAVVRHILKRVLWKFPEQAMWHMAWLCHSNSAPRKRIGEEIFNAAQQHLSDKNKSAGNILTASKTLFAHLHSVAKYESKEGNTKKRGMLSLKPWRGEVPLCRFIPPVQAALTAVLPASDSIGRSKDLFPRNVPRMRDFSPDVKVMPSKAKPKRITAFVIPSATTALLKRNPAGGKASRKPLPGDIGEIHFLIKQEVRGDLRKDARVQDLNTVINRLMASSRDAGKGGFSSQNRKLRLRTFAVTCLSEETGLIEWVPATTAMRQLICGTYNPQADEHSSRRRGNKLASFGNIHIRQAYENECQPLFFEHGKLEEAARLFERLLLKEYPPVFYWWFVHKFQDPHAWYEARTAFTLSAAAWSGVGHCIGLGDRHTENILLDTTTGECVHVDFDCIFDKALNLPKPEIVPFRLTANMVDAMGPTGAYGVYFESLKLVMRNLRDNRDTLLSVLEPFMKDPIIDWKRSRGSQSPKKSRSSRLELTQANDKQTREMKQTIRVVDERLRGIYNLRNPTLRKMNAKRKDGSDTAGQPDEFTKLLPLSVEGQVQQLITEATRSENLLQLYAGWMPWV